MSDRILMVHDGNAWFIRRVRAIEHDLTKDEKVYHCDEHLGGPFIILGEAIEAFRAEARKRGY